MSWEFAPSFLGRMRAMNQERDNLMGKTSLNIAICVVVAGVTITLTRTHAQWSENASPCHTRTTSALDDVKVCSLDVATMNKGSCLQGR